MAMFPFPSTPTCSTVARTPMVSIVSVEGT
jgi:hypothetical protein